MIGEISIGPYSGAVAISAFIRGTGTSAGSFSAVQIGTSLIRRTIDFGSLADGDYDLESTYPPGSWSMRVSGGVASIYDDWSEINFLSSASGTGQYSIVINVTDGSNPIPGAFVTIRRTGANLLWGYTDALGQLSVALDSGSYTLSASANQYSPVASQALTVSANGSTTITLAALPSSPGPSVPSIGDGVITFADLVYRLLTRRGLEGSDREKNQLRVAVDDAFRELQNKHTWKHFERRLTFMTEPEVTVEGSYDHTGGTYERLLTLTSGTAHSTFHLGEVRYQTGLYLVERVVSPTQVILDSKKNPGQDLSGSWSWRRATYTLPVLIRQINEIIREGSGQRLQNMSSLDIASTERMIQSTGSPSKYMIRSSDNYMGVTDIQLFPAPSEAVNYSVSLTARPDPMIVFEDTSDDAVATIGSTTITSASGIFNRRHEGCIIRLSPTDEKPIGLTQYDEGQGLPYYTFQTMIRRVVNPTTVEVVDTIPEDFTGNGFTISSVVDINVETMLSCLESLAWVRFCHNHDVKQLEIAKKANLEDMRAALDAESKVNWEIEAAYGSAVPRRLKYYAIYKDMS